ncbi:hypothetical protein D3C75_759550 [compost metagenome]
MCHQPTGDGPYQQRHEDEVGQQQGADEAAVAQALAQVEERDLQEHRVHQHGDGGGDQDFHVARSVAGQHTEGDGGQHGGEVDRDLLGFELFSGQGRPCVRWWKGTQVNTLRPLRARLQLLVQASQPALNQSTSRS